MTGTVSGGGLATVVEGDVVEGEVVDVDVVLDVEVVVPGPSGLPGAVVGGGGANVVVTTMVVAGGAAITVASVVVEIVSGTEGCTVAGTVEGAAVVVDPAGAGALDRGRSGTPTVATSVPSIAPSAVLEATVDVVVTCRPGATDQTGAIAVDASNCTTVGLDAPGMDRTTTREDTKSAPSPNSSAGNRSSPVEARANSDGPRRAPASRHGRADGAVITRPVIASAVAPLTAAEGTADADVRIDPRYGRFTNAPSGPAATAVTLPTDTFNSARTTTGSNWVPAFFVSSTLANCAGRAFLYDRAAVITS